MWHAAGKVPDQHIHVAAGRIEIGPQHRAEEAEAVHAARATEGVEPFAINRNGQFGDAHDRRMAEGGWDASAG